jgi:hypothetical protein
MEDTMISSHHCHRTTLLMQSACNAKGDFSSSLLRYTRQGDIGDIFYCTYEENVAG